MALSLLKAACLFCTIVQVSSGNHLVSDNTEDHILADETKPSLAEEYGSVYLALRNLFVEARDDGGSSYPSFIPNYIAAVIVAFVIGIYCFTLLAILCDKYFLPCVEQLCVILNIPEDVAAATFMSMATSAPEFFINIVSTFISGSDLGIGTVVGSSAFNTLFTPALGCLAVTSPLQLDWWPITRDSTFYIFSIALLVTFTWDNRIHWYEAMVLFIVYILYFVYMFLSTSVANHVRRAVVKNRILRKLYSIEEPPPGKESKVERNTSEILENTRSISVISTETIPKLSKEVYYTDGPIQRYIQVEDDGSSSETIFKKKKKWKLCTMPEGSMWKKIFFIYSWPLRLLLTCLIPNPIRFPRLIPISFLMCVACIGVNSYIVSWMVTIIGDTFGIPDTVMGFTLSAGGGALPEAFSLVIKARRGEGAMGVSNSLGANTMNILLSLGLPWFIRTIVDGANSDSYIRLESESIEYSVLALILVVIALYVIMMIGRFRLSRKSGIALLAVWVLFLAGVITVETLLGAQST